VERAIQIFAAVSFLVIGISHLAQPRIWVDYFAQLHRLGRPGAFAEGFLLLNFGALVVGFHNIWSGPAIVLTLVGWLHVLKSLSRFVVPGLILRVYARMTPERAWQIRAAGGLAVALAGFFAFLALRGSGG
jgi:hypothetical protein